MRQKLEGRGGQKRGGGILIGWKLGDNGMHRLTGNWLVMRCIDWLEIGPFFCSLNL